MGIKFKKTIKNKEDNKIIPNIEDNQFLQPPSYQPANNQENIIDDKLINNDWYTQIVKTADIDNNQEEIIVNKKNNKTINNVDNEKKLKNNKKQVNRRHRARNQKIEYKNVREFIPTTASRGFASTTTSRSFSPETTTREFASTTTSREFSPETTSRAFSSKTTSRKTNKKTNHINVYVIFTTTRYKDEWKQTEWYILDKINGISKMKQFTSQKQVIEYIRTHYDNIVEILVDRAGQVQLKNKKVVNLRIYTGGKRIIPQSGISAIDTAADIEKTETLKVNLEESEEERKRRRTQNIILKDRGSKRFAIFLTIIFLLALGCSITALLYEFHLIDPMVKWFSNIGS